MPWWLPVALLPVAFVVAVGARDAVAWVGRPFAGFLFLDNRVVVSIGRPQWRDPALRRFEHAAPNELWQMDFKGHFALESGRCHPLTVLDDHSRYLEAVVPGDKGTLRIASIYAPNGNPIGTEKFQFKLQFMMFVPTAQLFAQMRTAMAAQDLAVQFDVDFGDNGLERFITATRRQNFLVPPRRHRSFPLLELG